MREDIELEMSISSMAVLAVGYQGRMERWIVIFILVMAAQG
jgi:hypothetical protein